MLKTIFEEKFNEEWTYEYDFETGTVSLSWNDKMNVLFTLNDSEQLVYDVIWSDDASDNFKINNEMSIKTKLKYFVENYLEEFLESM